MSKTVKENILAQCTAGGHALSARRLFILFAAHARTSYQYSAVKLKGSEGNTLLARPKDEIVTVDCAALADAFVDLVNGCIEGENAARVMVKHGGEGFATQASSRCFDTNIGGNIRKPAETWAATGRCVFMEHYFVETGSDTRMLYDPCMFTTYSNKDEVMSWKFQSGGATFSSIVKRVIGDPSLLLVRVPPDDPSPKPRGFESGMILFKASDLKKDEHSALWGRRENKSWSDAQFETNKNAALVSINKLLKDRAGVTTGWQFPR